MITCGFRACRPGAKLPKRATEGSSGYDLTACERVVVPNRSTVAIPTGVSIALEPGYEAQVRSRSGLAARRGLHVLNSPGTIDSDYRGEIMVIMHNTTNADQLFDAGDRIAQLVFAKVESVQWVEAMDETERGEGGLGSSGV